MGEDEGAGCLGVWGCDAVDEVGEDDCFAGAGGEGDAEAFVALGYGGQDCLDAFFLVGAEFDGGWW